MALPDLIEIVPLTAPVRAEITVPGSKSITNRALILAALADGEVTLKGALWSEDTQIMVECLQNFGFAVDVKPDPDEFCNRTIMVKGLGGKIPNGGTVEKPLELFVGNAGTAARFLSAFVCLGNGVYRLSGVARMRERPQAALLQALRELGYRVESEKGNDRLPVTIFGGEVGAARCADRTPQRGVPAKRSCRVSIEQSSQFASALLLCAKRGGWDVKITGENADESPYVAMTMKLIEAFPKAGGKFQIEPDASSGSYFIGAGWLLNQCEFFQGRAQRIELAQIQLSHVSVPLWPDSQWQMDEAFLQLTRIGIPSLDIGSDMENIQFVQSPLKFSRNADLGDSIMTQITLSPILRWGLKEAIFTDLGRLRVQECERVVALRTELIKCGAKVVEEDDTLTVWPSPLHGAEIETYHDHRMAMCFAILGLKVPGIKIKNPACVKKTFPNFFQKLAALPPHGLGAEIWEVKAGQRTRKLSGDDLFAD
jgi:3-phosphoshikimate 1-carboxyvinyltransferase